MYDLNAEFPSELKFLIGQRSDDVVEFLAGRVGHDDIIASGGQIAIHRNSFNLVMKRPTSYGVEGILELFSPKEFCAVINGGVFLSIAIGNEPIATLRLTADGTGVHGDDSAFQLSVDRIGRRYYDTFRFFLASDLYWLPVWKSVNSNAPFSSTRNWPDYYTTNQCGDSGCSYLGNMAALEALLDLVGNTKLYPQSKFPTHEEFRLSSMPVIVSFPPQVISECLSLTAKSGGKPVSFCLNSNGYLHIADVHSVPYNYLGMKEYLWEESGDFGVPNP
ncbi:hypothetical protein ACU8LZ_12515 [Rhizobium leguminosarum]